MLGLRLSGITVAPESGDHAAGKEGTRFPPGCSRGLLSHLSSCCLLLPRVQTEMKQERQVGDTARTPLRSCQQLKKRS